MRINWKTVEKPPCKNRFIITCDGWNVKTLEEKAVLQEKKSSERFDKVH